MNIADFKKKLQRDLIAAGRIGGRLEGLEITIGDLLMNLDSFSDCSSGTEIGLTIRTELLHGVADLLERHQREKRALKEMGILRKYFRRPFSPYSTSWQLRGLHWKLDKNDRKPRKFHLNICSLIVKAVSEIAAAIKEEVKDYEIVIEIFRCSKSK